MRSYARRISEPDRRAGQISRAAALFFAVLLPCACSLPFPGPPDTLPDCDFHPATEFCGVVKDSARRDIPFIVVQDRNSAKSQSVGR